MFCPKCGNTLPDGAAFCGSCGNKINTVANPVAAGVVGEPVVGTPLGATPASKGNISSRQLATIIVAVIAIIFAFMPWFETSLTLQGFGGGANFLSSLGSSLTGKDLGNYKIDEAYSPAGFIDLGGKISKLSKFGNSGPEGIIILAFFAWLPGVVVLAAGLIVMLTSSKRTAVVVGIGAAILAIVSLLWVLVYGMFVSGGYAKGFAGNALLCAACSIVVIVLAFVSSKNTSATQVSVSNVQGV